MDELSHPEHYAPITRGPIVAVVILIVLGPFIVVNALIRFISGKINHV